MPQDEFIRTILAVSDALSELKRSRVLLDCFWDKVADFHTDGIPDDKQEEIENLFFLLESYDKISLNSLDELNRSIAESMTTIEQMRREGFFDKVS